MSMRILEAKLGQVVASDSTRDMPTAEIVENIEQALRRGFRELTEAEFSIEQSSVEHELQRAIAEPIQPGSIFTSWQDLKSEFKQYLFNNPEEYLSKELQNFCVFDEHCQLDHHLKIEFSSDGPTAQTATRNLIFKKGLTINGNLDAGACTTELPQLLVIIGDLHVKHLILTGWIELIVTGDLKVDGVLFAYDGEAGGRLKVHGNLSATHMLCGMMFNIEVAGRIEGAVYETDDSETTLPNPSSVPTALSSVQGDDLSKHSPLVKDAYYLEGNWATGEEVQTLVFDPSQAVSILREDKPLFNSSTR